MHLKDDNTFEACENGAWLCRCCW